MIGEIGRGTAQFLAFGEYVPQDFAESYYIAGTSMYLGFNFMIAMVRAI